jgi:hypothetical protein
MVPNEKNTPIPAAESKSEFTIGDNDKPFALIADFGSVAAVMTAAERVRDAEYTLWDVHAPLPIHGINQAMGLRPTILPWITLVHGLVGCGLGLLMVWWINATEFDGVPTPLQGYPFLISGKPVFSLPANIPVIFEMTILFAAIGTLLGLLGLNKQPMLSNPLNKSRLMQRATTDRFLVVIYAENAKFDLQETADFLRSLGPDRMELVTD